MVTPTFADYVQLLFTQFERFMQQPAAHTHRGHPFVYLHQALIVFFIIMQQRHIFRFKAQRRWLEQHPELRLPIGLETIPDRSTLSRRYKALYPVLQDFITFLGQYAEDLAPYFDSEHLYEDKSLFKPENGECAHMPCSGDLDDPGGDDREQHLGPTVAQHFCDGGRLYLTNCAHPSIN